MIQKIKDIKKLTDILSPYRNFIFIYYLFYDKENKMNDIDIFAYFVTNFITILWVFANAFIFGNLFGLMHTTLTYVVFLLYFEFNLLFLLFQQIKRNRIPSYKTIERYIYHLFKLESEGKMKGIILLTVFPVFQLLFYFMADVFIPYHRRTSQYFINHHFKWVAYVMLLSIFIYFVLFLFSYLYLKTKQKRNKY